ncbi:hypothetical protein BDP27DRAFT_1367606 [Rhodocollybia butyracea]|uniref:Uncharacterized protein n=1 Tax=Rhodocollybia butyracea TaxID=206335 RepID=A0A9P5PIG4_9AGAR|nr:hypothetical protein BDP27DRAFT_1367606 [Rhodocollybia butyracea]
MSSSSPTLNALSQEFEIQLSDSSLTEIVQMSKMALHNTDGQKLGVVHSIIPCAVRCVLDILSATPENSRLLNLQSIYVPAVSNYQKTSSKLNVNERSEYLETLHLEVQRLQKVLRVQMTMERGEKDFWAFVPQVHDQGERWNHQEDPTILFTPTLDRLFRSCKSSEERSHVLAFTLIVIFHELGHLLCRSIHGTESKDTPESIKFSRGSRVSDDAGKGEGERAEQRVTGGYNFKIANNMSLESADSDCPESHGYRIMGDIDLLESRPNGVYQQHTQVVVRDDRIDEFLAFFFLHGGDHHRRLPYPVPLVINSEDNLDVYAIPLHTQVYKEVYGDLTKLPAPVSLFPHSPLPSSQDSPRSSPHLEPRAMSDTPPSHQYRSMPLAGLGSPIRLTPVAPASNPQTYTSRIASDKDLSSAIPRKRLVPSVRTNDNLAKL